MKKIEFLMENIQRFNKNIKRHADNRFLYCWVSMVWCGLRFGSSFDDFFRYKFHEKNNYERDKFITYRRSKKIIKKYNEPNHINLFQNKCLFNSHFKHYIRRDWLDLSACSQKEFNEFVKKYKTIMFKPISGSKGQGIVRYQYNSSDNLESILSRHRNCIAEEIIIQHKSMAEINPSSVNSIRIISFLKGNDVHIIGCTLRTGSSNTFTDNFSAGGVAASIDIESGIVFTPCINKELQRFLYHPVTKQQVIGFKIPNWDNVIKTVKSAAKIVPEVNYIGWDIAILEDGVDIIEANHDSAHRIVQMIDQVGKYPIIKKYI
ncbi:MAG: hypothetical protein GX947_07935 [Tissierellia bacterium]|nr:hypothetical protein [Tissierellia bacterium]